MRCFQIFHIRKASLRERELRRIQPQPNYSARWHIAREKRIPEKSGSLAKVLCSTIRLTWRTSASLRRVHHVVYPFLPYAVVDTIRARRFIGIHNRDSAMTSTRRRLFSMRFCNALMFL